LRELDSTSTQASVFFENVEEDKVESEEIVKCIPKEGHEEKTCFTCHEPFETFWDEDMDEWMLRDAIKVKDLYYHNSCFSEVGNENSISSTSSVDSVLGKRKASIEKDDQ
jgi:pre-mRNA cleavage complex 2 protein Pcf11